MVFLYNELAGLKNIEIINEQYLHFKARRIKIGDRIEVRNLKDNYNYLYEVKEISKKQIFLELVFKNTIQIIENKLTVAWAVVDTTVIEKTLPFLNELGVKKIIFVYSEFSQKNIKLDLKRFERILVNSSQQCGRNSIIEFEIFDTCASFLDKYNNVSLIDFGGGKLGEISAEEIPFIGPEGGFSDNERQMFKKSYALNCPYILRSNTAILSVVNKIIL